MMSLLHVACCAVATFYCFQAPYGLQGGNAPWLITWFLALC